MKINSIILEDIEKIIATTAVNWSVFAGRRVLITGASGFLPAYLVETLLYLNQTKNFDIHITALVRSKENFEKRFAHHLDNPNLIALVQDVSTPIKLELPHHFIIHAASQASPKYYGIDPVGTLSANILGTMQLLELARAHPVISFMYFSSGEVYGETQSIPTKESDYGYIDPTSVRSCYAESKRMGENMCVSWHAQYQVPSKIVRPFHTYGPGMKLDDGRVYADFVRDVIESRPIVLKSAGTASRAFCYLADATAGFFTVLLNGENGIPYNVGNSQAEISIKDLASLLVDSFPEKRLRVTTEVIKADSSYLQSPISRNCPDISRIKTLGWKPKTSLADGFKRTIESYSI
ncbi:MAG: NAD-dependent epimerase/dehydratase family protein [Sulfuriferula sp.]